MGRAVIGGRRTSLTDFVRGAFGRFTTTGADQITFLSTRFDKPLLERVVTAREVFPRRQMRVRELIQRDIDDNRVREEIVSYLRPAAGHVGPRFFPPIIIAVFPAGGSPDEPLAEFYPAAVRPGGRFPRVPEPAEGNQLYEVWDYGGDLRFRIPLPDLADPAHLMQLELDDVAVFQGAELGWNRDRVRLVAIDGQHRLLALKAVFGILNDDERARGYDRLPEEPTGGAVDLALRHVPVCLLLAPELYEGSPAGGDTTLFKVFRQLFVDINKNARVVSESRNILLNERDAIAVFTRNLVDSFLPEVDLPATAAVDADHIPLYAFEIDPPEHREEQINDVRAVSSVGLLNTLISNLLLDGEENTDRFRTALEIEEGDAELDPNEVGREGVPPVDLDHERFTLWQRDVLETRFRTQWQAGLVKVLRQLYPADDLIRELERERVRLRGERDDPAQKDNPLPGTAYDYLVGSEGDRRQIEYVSGLTDPVGRFVPTACATAVESYRKFVTDTLVPIRNRPFGRLFFSNVGQQQLLECVFRTLAEFEPELSAVDRASAWIADFNAAYRSSPGHESFFERNQPWNEPIIKTLSTQANRQKHIGGLLMMSAAAFPRDGRMAGAFGTEWRVMQDDLVERGWKAIRDGIANHLRRQIAQLPQMRVIRSPRTKAQRIGEELQRQLTAAFAPLRALFRGWGGKAAEYASRVIGGEAGEE